MSWAFLATGLLNALASGLDFAVGVPIAGALFAISAFVWFFLFVEETRS